MPLQIPPFPTPLKPGERGELPWDWAEFFLNLQTMVNSGTAFPGAPFLTYKADADLTAPQNLGLLSTGYLKVAVAAAVATLSSVAGIPVADLIGKVGLAQGGTNADLSATGGASQVLKQATAGGAVTVAQLATTDISGLGITGALLHAGQGTDTTAGATTVDSIAISGLTAKDILWVVTVLESAAQPTAQANLYSVTDAVALMAITNAPLAAGTGAVAQTSLSQRQGNANATQAGTTISGFGAFGAFAAVATAWTGAWTLGLRHGGVTAGGTFKWMWQVWKLPGQ